MQSPTPFLHIDAGQLITMGVIGVAWFVSKGMDWRGSQDRLKAVEEWQKQHDADCRERNELIRKLESNSQRLTILMEIAEKRLTTVEARTFSKS